MGLSSPKSDEELSMAVKGPGGRRKIHEIVVNEIVVELWLKPSSNTDRVYFDVTLSQKYYYNDEEEIGEFVQLRYINDALVAVIQAETWFYTNREKYYSQNENPSRTRT